MLCSAELDASFAEPPAQFCRYLGRLAAEEAGDGLARFYDETELALLVPSVGIAAELERPGNVRMADRGSQAMRIVAESQIVVRIGNAVELPFLLGLPEERVVVEGLQAGLGEYLQADLCRLRDVGEANLLDRFLRPDLSQRLDIGRLPCHGDSDASLDRPAVVLQFEPRHLPQRFSWPGLEKERGRLKCDDPHSVRGFAPSGCTPGKDGSEDQNQPVHGITRS